MPPTVMGNGMGDEIDGVSKVAQDYYDSDNAFNFYRQVNTFHVDTFVVCACTIHFLRL